MPRLPRAAVGAFAPQLHHGLLNRCRPTTAFGDFELHLVGKACNSTAIVTKKVWVLVTLVWTTWIGAESIAVYALGPTHNRGQLGLP